MSQKEINHSQNVNAHKQQINDLATQLHQQQAATQQFNHTVTDPIHLKHELLKINKQNKQLLTRLSLPENPHENI